MYGRSNIDIANPGDDWFLGMELLLEPRGLGQKGTFIPCGDFHLRLFTKLSAAFDRRIAVDRGDTLLYPRFDRDSENSVFEPPLAGGLLLL